MTTRVIGIGHPDVGDDGVGIEIVRRLRRQGLPGRVELVESMEPSELVSLFQDVERIVLVDAIVGRDGAGSVRVVRPEQLAAAGTLLTTHGLRVETAIDLARNLHPDTVAPDIRIVGITIERPVRVGPGLSPAVETAVPEAIRQIRRLLADRRGAVSDG